MLQSVALEANLADVGPLRSVHHSVRFKLGSHRKAFLAHSAVKGLEVTMPALCSTRLLLYVKRL